MLIRRNTNPWFRMMDALMEGLTTEPAPRDNMMALDVREDDTTYTIMAAVPGVKQEDINVQLHDGVLSIEAEIKSETTRENERTLVQERRYGRFARSLRLPNDVDGDNIQARYQDGVLTLTLPKVAQAQPRKIAINSNN
ncbi:MAG: Hsp20/alpha crystallin family protein [Anaerolineae bacterium]|nr:Hsp20/alpha crystallin family protein [Anaerolineae bacterium]MDW8171176.1 Hsp20/alpha crystallin family protein [Anaerolineae bacterium]